MKLLIDTDSLGWQVLKLNNAAEWDAFMLDYIPQKRGGKKPPMTYRPEPQYKYPTEYPCIMVYDENDITNNPEGADWFFNQFWNEKDCSIIEE